MKANEVFSKYTELVPTHNKEATMIAQTFVEKWVCSFGVPAAIVSDSGKDFLNKVMAGMTNHLGTKQAATSAFHPWTNASAERCHRTMIGHLSTMLDNDQSLNWEEWLPVLMLSYNTQVYKATLEPPFFLTFLHMLFFGPPAAEAIIWGKLRFRGNGPPSHCLHLRDRALAACQTPEGEVLQQQAQGAVLCSW